MISLSNLYTANERKQIKIKTIKPLQTQIEEQASSNQSLMKHEQLGGELKKQQQELADLQLKRKKLLEQIETEVQAEKEAWQTEKMKYIEAAKQEGFEAGFSQGKSESLAKYKEYLVKANQIIETAKRDYHAIIEQHVDAILEIAVQTAEKIIQQKLNDDPEVFLSIIKAAIKELNDQSEVAIYLHPNQYAFVVQHKDELASLLENNTKLSCYVSDELKENGCMIKHQFGQVDASIDTQLEELRYILLEIAGENKQ
jgi:flagellar assembly protein FliH